MQLLYFLSVANVHTLQIHRRGYLSDVYTCILSFECNSHKCTLFQMLLLYTLSVVHKLQTQMRGFLADNNASVSKRKEG